MYNIYDEKVRKPRFSIINNNDKIFFILSLDFINNILFLAITYFLYFLK